MGDLTCLENVQQTLFLLIMWKLQIQNPYNNTYNHGWHNLLWNPHFYSFSMICHQFPFQRWGETQATHQLSFWIHHGLLCLQPLSNPFQASQFQCCLQLWSWKESILLWLLSESYCPLTWERQPYMSSSIQSSYHQELVVNSKILLFYCPSWIEYIENPRAHLTRTRCFLWCKLNFLFNM